MNKQTCHSFRFNRNHSDFLLKCGPFPIFQICWKYSDFFRNLFSLSTLKKKIIFSFFKINRQHLTINVDAIVILNIDIVFYYIIKCVIEIGTSILVVTIPNIDSAELFTLSLIRLHFTIPPSSHPDTPLFPTKDHSYFIF